MFVKVGDELTWESKAEKLLGVIIDKNLNFDNHLSILTSKAGQKVTALARVTNVLPFHKRRLILKSFIESQFSHCPLVWMFCSRKMNRKINHIHERALRLVYEDYTSTFSELLEKDKSISIHHRNIHIVAIEMFKVVHDLCPPFMSKIFQLYNGAITRSSRRFVRPKINTAYKGENSFRSFGPIVWDEMLPDRLKICTSLSEFKSTIKSWIPENCTCRLCKTYIRELGFVTVRNDFP